VYSAYGCGYCAQTAAILDQLRKRFPERVSIHIKHFPLNGSADELWAHKAAFAAGQQDALGPVHRILFDVASGSVSHAALRTAFAERGGDLRLFDSVIDSIQPSRSIEGDRREAIALGVTVTPTVFIDGFKLEGLHQAAVYENLIEFGLNGVAESPDTGAGAPAPPSVAEDLSGSRVQSR
jgi:predicted DsbA family dithiol-disulfide isomerase